MKKRILSVLIALVMLIGLVSVMSISASAAAGYLRKGLLRSGTVYSDDVRAGDILKPGTQIRTHTGGVEIRIRQEPGGGSVDEYRLSRNETWPGSANYYYNSAFYVDHVNTSEWIICLISIETADIIFDYNDGTGSSTTKPWYTKVPMQHERALYQASAPEITRTGYTFVGWNTKADGTGTEFISTSSEDFSVTGDTTLYAQWKPNKYAITFKNDDGSTLQSGNWDYDTTPTYTGATPTKAATAQYNYTFTGWSPAIATVTGDATYTAQFSSTVNKYTITFKNDDGSTLQSSEWDYGATPTYTGATPTKASDAMYDYTFAGWDVMPTSVTGNVTYTATYNASLRTYGASVGESLHGSVTLVPTSAQVGGAVTVLITPNEGYEVDAVTFNGVAATKVSENNYTFTMPAADAVVAVTYKKIPYNVTLFNDGTAAGGRFSVDMSTATIGDTVTITVAPNLGYFIEAVTFNGAAAINNGGGTYSFTMPAQNVSVSVAFDVDLPAIAKELQLLNDADAALKTAINKGDNDLTAEIAELSTAITKAQDAIDDLDNDYATDTQLNDLKSALEAAENTMTTAINALKDRVTEIENQLRDIDLSQIATNKQEIANLTTELDAVKDTVDQLDNTFINNTELSDALGNLKAELDGVDNALKALITALDGRVKDIEDALDGIDLSQIATNKQDIADLTTELGDLNTLVNTIKTNYITADTNLQAQITALDTKLTELIDKTIAELTDSVNKLKDDLNTANGKIITNASDVATLKNDVSTLKTWKDNAQSAIEALQTLTGTQSGEINTLKDAVRDLISAMNSAEAKITAAENRIATLEGKVVDLETAKADLQSKVNALQTAINTKASTADVNNAIADLRDAIATAENTAKANTDSVSTTLTAAIATAKSEAIKAAEGLVNAAKTELQGKIDAKASKDDVNTAIADLRDAIATAENTAKAYTDSVSGTLRNEISAAQNTLQAAITLVQENLDKVEGRLEKAISDLEVAMKQGDADLYTEIANLNTALTNAKGALEKADADNKAALEAKIEDAESTLDAAIKAVQKNLDDAKAELNKAIADGDTALDDKISALNKALATAKAALEATDSANKSELITKIDEADATLKAAIDALSNELNATNEKVAELETFIIIVCVISGVAFCGCGTLAVFYIIDKKKKI